MSEAFVFYVISQGFTILSFITVPNGIMGFEIRNVGRDGFAVNRTSLKITPVVDRR